jgi:deoxyribodipyrimidine photo-lyase
MKKVKRIIVWFQQDLRLHDNEALSQAYDRAEEVVPVYVFDIRKFNDLTSFGFRKTSAFRAQFIIQAVEDLKQSFKSIGSNLVIRVGIPEDEVYKIAQQTKANWVFCNRERTYEEANVQSKLEKNLWSLGVELRYFRGKMLYYTQDLPFPVAQTPDIFTNFRKEMEKFITVRAPFAAPHYAKPLTTSVNLGTLPTLQDLNYEPVKIDTRATFSFVGGETAALQRLKYYLWDSDLIKTYEETRNGMLGGDYSSKLSPYLALGCISPKLIYQQLKQYELQRGDNKSTYWLYFELLWRDYFRLMGKKYDNKIFQIDGIRAKTNPKLSNNKQKFLQWANANTAQPFINANMNELNATGFMSNRGRQNVASYLVNDLNVNWIMGAEYFESLLIDYDVCSNWCNWLYIAGLGNDPREDRYFNTQTQYNRYDPQGTYTKHWTLK